MLATAVTAAAELAAPGPEADHRPHPGRPAAALRADQRPVVLLAVVACAFIGIAIAGAVASFCADFWLERAGERIVHDLRTATYQHLQRLSLAFHDRRPKGDLVTRVTGDVSAIGDLFAQTLGTLASAVLVLVGMLVVTLLLDPVLALATFLVAPPLAAITAHYQKKIRLAARRQRAKEGEIASLANEALSAMHVVKAFGTERFEHERVERTSAERLEAGVYVSRTEAFFGGLVDILGSISTAIVLVFGTLRVASGALTPGELVVFVTYTGKLYRPLRDLARTANRTSRAMARAERIGEILSADDVLHERPGRPRAAGRVDASSCGTCPSATPRAGRRCTRSRSRSPRASSLRWSALGGREVDHRRARGPLLRPALGVCPARRPRRPRLDARLAARPGRGAAAGDDPVLGERRREHRLRERDAPTTSCWPRPGPPARTASSRRCRRATTPGSARAASASRAGSASASGSPGCSCATRRCWCSTSRRLASTPTARPASSTACAGSCSGVPRSSSPTRRPWRRAPTGSRCSRAAASSSSASPTSCSRAAAPSPASPRPSAPPPPARRLREGLLR